MRHPPRNVLGVVIAWSMLLPVSGFGQTASHAPPNTQNTKRVEGTITRVDGNELLLTVKGGTTETYQLSPGGQILQSRPGLMTDLSAGKFVGCTSIYDHGTTVLAGECHIFSDGLHGVAEGRGATGTPDTSAVNGAITDVRDDPGAAADKGRRILVLVSYKDGATTMTVSSLTKITVLRTGDASALKRGAKVRGISEQAADGTGVIQTLTVLNE
jgi:hypothetical protein